MNNQSPRYFAFIPASGTGSRMQSQQPKQYLSIMGKPMILHVLDTFAQSTYITHTFVVINKEDTTLPSLLATQPHLQQKVTLLFEGGATRQETVYQGLQAIASQIQQNDWVLIHDAARPGLTTALLQQLITQIGEDTVGGLLALPVVDTLKKATQDRATHTVPRQDMWAAQTPQMFRYHLLCEAFEQMKSQLHTITDDASAIEMLGYQPQLVTGSPANLKVTYPHDIALIEFLLNQ